MAVKSQASLSVEDLHPVYIICGTDTYTKSLFEKKIKEALINRYGYIDSRILDAREHDAASVIAELQSGSLFSSMSMLIVRNADKLLKLKDLKDFLKEYDKKTDISNYVVFDTLEERSSKTFENIKAEAPYENRLGLWIESYFAQKNLKISQDAVNILIFNCGRNLANLSQEIEKIITAYPEKKVFHIDEVKSISGTHKKDDVFAYLNAIQEYDLKKSLLLLENLLSFGAEPLQIVGILKWKTQQMLTARILMQKGISEKDIIRKMRLFPQFFYRGFCAKLQKFSVEKLKESYSRLLETDLALKTGAADSGLLLEKFTFQILTD